MNKKEWCCELKVENDYRIWYYDTYKEALDKLVELQDIQREIICLYAGKTKNKDRKRHIPLLTQEEVDDIVRETFDTNVETLIDE